MENQFTRTEILLGKEKMERLRAARVAVFGVGGVGGYVVEAVARSGVGNIDIIDDDRVCVSNLNRQILATVDTIGRHKVDVARERILSINPDCAVRGYKTFFLPETAGEFDFSRYDYVADAIDTVTGKLELVVRAGEAGVPIISSMGAGNKLDGAGFMVADISETSVCPLARVMRRELKKRGIHHLKVVYSREKALTPLGAPAEPAGEAAPGAGRGGAPRRQSPGSVAFVPAVAGLIMAGEIVKDIGEGAGYEKI